MPPRHRSTKTRTSPRGRKGRRSGIVLGSLAIARAAKGLAGRTSSRPRRPVVVVNVKSPRRINLAHRTRAFTIATCAFAVGRWVTAHPEQVRHYRDMATHQRDHLRELLAQGQHNGGDGHAQRHPAGAGSRS